MHHLNHRPLAKKEIQRRVNQEQSEYCGGHHSDRPQLDQEQPGQ